MLSQRRRIPSENDDTSMKGNETLDPKGWIVGLFIFENNEIHDKCKLPHDRRYIC